MLGPVVGDALAGEHRFNDMPVIIGSSMNGEPRTHMGRSVPCDHVFGH